MAALHPSIRIDLARAIAAGGGKPPPRHRDAQRLLRNARRWRRHGTLEQELAEALESAGVRFVGEDPFPGLLGRMDRFLRRHMRAPRVGAGEPEERELGRWARRLLEHERAHGFEGRRREALAALPGWTWKGGGDPRGWAAEWTRRLLCEEVKTFTEAHGRLPGQGGGSSARERNLARRIYRYGLHRRLSSPPRPPPRTSRQENLSDTE